MVLEQMNVCSCCGLPRFTPGLCQDCQNDPDKVSHQLRELQTQVTLYKKLTEQQKYTIEGIKVCFEALQQHGATTHVINGFKAHLKIEEKEG